LNEWKRVFTWLSADPYVVLMVHGRFGSLMVDVDRELHAIQAC
jgi:hypothetical protein